MPPLPPHVSQRLQHLPNVVSAYNICLGLEERIGLGMVTGPGRKIENDLVYVRILGYLIHHTPDLGLRTVVYEIVSCKDDFALLSVGRMYYDHYIRACRFINPLIHSRII